jgi:hypothetical protein
MIGQDQDKGQSAALKLPCFQARVHEALAEHAFRAGEFPAAEHHYALATQLVPKWQPFDVKRQLALASARRPELGRKT